MPSNKNRTRQKTKSLKSPKRAKAAAPSVSRATSPVRASTTARMPAVAIETATRSTKSKGLESYERRVRAEVEKKVGKGQFFTDVYNAQYIKLIQRAYRSEVHPTAVAGVLLIATGLAPEKAPGGLCCGQE